MCGALAWLSSTSTLPDDHCRKKKEPKKKENSDFPSWLSMETDEDAEKRMLQETKERLASKFGEDGLASQVGGRLA